MSAVELVSTVELPLRWMKDLLGLLSKDFADKDCPAHTKYESTNMEYRWLFEISRDAYSRSVNS